MFVAVGHDYSVSIPMATKTYMGEHLASQSRLLLLYM